MANLSLNETYVTKNGARETPTQLTGEAHTISASTVTFAGGDLTYAELIERPSSADGYQPTVTDPDSVITYTQTETTAPTYNGTDSAEFYIDYRTSRLYFHEDVAGETITVDYYGYGTVIRNEHINLLQTDLNKVQSRAMVGVNNVTWVLGASGGGSVSFNATAGTLSFDDGVLYLPPKFDNSVSSITYSTSTGTLSGFANGDVLICPVAESAVTLSDSNIVTFSTDLTDSTDANLVLAYRIHDLCYLINGVVLADGDSWSPSDGVSSGGDTGKFTSVFSDGSFDLTDTWTFTHGLGSQWVVVQVYDNSDPPEQITPANISVGELTASVTITSFSSSVAENFRVVIVG